MSTQSVTNVSLAPPASGLAIADCPAALWRRATARLVDAAVVFFMLWALVVLRVLWFMDSLSERVTPEPWGRAFIATVAFVALHLLYEVVFLTFNQGQTPGKERLKVQVVRQRDHGAPGLARVALRSVPPALVWLASPVWLAMAMLFALGTTSPLHRRRVTWHDQLSGTVVVHYDRRLHEGEDE